MYSFNIYITLNDKNNIPKMPRKIYNGNKLERVVSTKISESDFKLLQKYARVSYNRELIVLPTISNMLRWVIHRWANEKRKAEEYKNNQSTTTIDIIDDPR